MKGIILAGGAGTRLHPITRSVSQAAAPGLRQADDLLPAVALMLAGIRDILVITHAAGPAALPSACSATAANGACARLRRAGRAEGLAQAFIIGARVRRRRPGRARPRRQHLLRPGFRADAARRGARSATGAMMFGYPVRDPSGTAWSRSTHAGRRSSHRGEAGASRSPTWRSPASTSTTTTWSTSPRELRPSARGELEITDLNNIYVQQGKASLIDLGAVSPGWTPAPTIRCWRPGSSSRCWSTGRACGSPAWRRSRWYRASSTPTVPGARAVAGEVAVRPVHRAAGDGRVASGTPQSSVLMVRSAEKPLRSRAGCSLALPTPAV